MTPEMRFNTETNRVLASESRAELLQALRDASGELTIADLSEECGLHPNTVREHLNLLIAAGFVTRKSASDGGRGRPRMVYTFNSSGSLPNQRSQKDTEAISLLCRVLAAQAASLGKYHTWQMVEQGATDWIKQFSVVPPETRADTVEEALAVVEQLLELRGFQPTRGEGDQTVVLHHCPYSDLAVEQQQVVCGAHLGLIRGSLHQLNSPVTAVFTEIDPETPRCVVQVVSARQQPEAVSAPKELQ